MARTLVRELSPDKQKNHLLNGSFEIWQRGSSFGSISQYGYYADRWVNQSGSNTSASLSQQVYSPVLDNNVRVSLRWTAGSTSSQFNIAQALQQTDIAPIAGKTITFSIYARINSGNVRTYTVSVQKNATANTLSGGSWSTVGSSTPVALTTSFQRLSVTVTVPNDGTANGLRFMIYDIQTGLAADYIEVTQAQVNVGSVAAPFTFKAVDILAELQLCEIFYQVQYFSVSAYLGRYGVRGSGYFDGQAVSFKTMRAVPTLSTNLTTFNTYWVDPGINSYEANHVHTVYFNMTSSAWALNTPRVAGGVAPVVNNVYHMEAAFYVYLNAEIV